MTSHRLTIQSVAPSGVIFFLVIIQGPVPFLIENPRNCGTKTEDVLDIFVAGQLSANQLNILMHLQLL